MLLSQLTELAWKWYQNGKPQASKQQLIQADIEQKIKTLFASLMRQRYYESMKMDPTGEPDWSISSPILSVQKFTVGDPGINGMRRIDMGKFDLYRMPKNSHISAVYPLSQSCNGEIIEQPVQVNPSEENFYINNPDLSEYLFYSVKGRGLDTYNFPPCVKEVNVESTFDLDGNVDVDNSMAEDIIDQILNVSLGIKKQYYSEDVQKQMAEQNLVK